jgi:hypothetical protein
VLRSVRIRAWLWCCLGLLAVTNVARADAYRYQGVDRLVAVADSHGAYEQFSSLLRETGVVDEQLQWSGGKTHFVNLGDFTDRGPDSRKIMDLLMRLQAQAGQSGGQVHVLLGNHELMNLTGDLRYVSDEEYLSYTDLEDEDERRAARDYFESRQLEPGSRSFDETYPRGYFGHRRAFSPTGKYGSWLRSLPFLIVIDSTVFTHGGLPPLVADLGLEATNQSLARDLADYERMWAEIKQDLGLVLPTTFRQRPRLARSLAVPVVDTFKKQYWKPLFSPEGPLWSREASMCLPVTVEQDLDAALVKLGADTLVVGHTVTYNNQVSSRLDGRVIMLDTGMLASSYPGGVASALVIEKGVRTATYLGGGSGHKILPESRRVGPRPGLMSDDELEEFLSNAEVIKIETLGSGITRPRRVTLERDGMRVRGLFKGVSHTEQRMGNAVIEFADHWHNEVAAYKLDRLLDLQVVPVTVEREIDGRRGSLQFWVDGLINWRTVTEQGLEPGDWCAMEPQYQLLKVFDALIHNLDRTQENLTFEKSDWILVLIDHSRAFAAKSRILQKNLSEYLVVTPPMARRLQSLEQEQLMNAIRPYLSQSQIRALLARRDILLRGFMKKPPAPEPEIDPRHAENM